MACIFPRSYKIHSSKPSDDHRVSKLSSNVFSGKFPSCPLAVTSLISNLIGCISSEKTGKPGITRIIVNSKYKINGTFFFLNLIVLLLQHKQYSTTTYLNLTPFINSNENAIIFSL